MKLLRRASSAIVLAIVFTCTFNSLSAQSTRITKFEKPTTFEIKPVSFQEWYAGIEVGGTGFNVYIPVSNIGENAELDTVYFRNLKGKLVKEGDEYMAVLKNDSPYYTFKKAEKPKGYPVRLKDNECAISYIENGKTKYFKIKELNEYAGMYYEEGPPSVVTRKTSAIVASTDEDDE